MLPSILRGSNAKHPTDETDTAPSMPAAVERMSRVDTAWLRMDNDVNLMMIVGVWLLRPASRYAALCERVQDKLLQYERFRQKVVQDATGASWVDDADFDIAAPRRAREAAARGRARANARRCSVASASWRTTPLDPAGRSGSST